MAKRNGFGLVGSLVVVGVVYGVLVASEHQSFALPAAAAVGLLLLLASRPRKCQACGGVITKGAMRWKVNGRALVVCPACSRRLQSKASKDGLDKLFAKR